MNAIFYNGPSACEIIKDMYVKIVLKAKEYENLKISHADSTISLALTYIYVCHSDEQCININNNAGDDDSDEE